MNLNWIVDNQRLTKTEVQGFNARKLLGEIFPGWRCCCAPFPTVAPPFLKRGRAQPPFRRRRAFSDVLPSGGERAGRGWRAESLRDSRMCSRIGKRPLQGRLGGGLSPGGGLFPASSVPNRLRCGAISSRPPPHAAKHADATASSQKPSQNREELALAPVVPLWHHAAMMNETRTQFSFTR